LSSGRWNSSRVRPGTSKRILSLWRSSQVSRRTSGRLPHLRKKRNEPTFFIMPQQLTGRILTNTFLLISYNIYLFMASLLWLSWILCTFCTLYWTNRGLYIALHYFCCCFTYWQE
jgi:hypothetical protein